MNEIINKIRNDIETYFMEDMENQNKNIDFILVNPKTNEIQVLASDGMEEIILFSPYTKELKNEYMNIPEWDFNFDEYFFKELQKGYDVGFVSDDTHYGLWNTIIDLYPEDIENLQGVQKYLQYCKDNNITAEYLNDSMKMNIKDAMKYYDYPLGVVELRDNNVIMSKLTLDKQNETTYIAFVLGYDLLNDKLQNSNYPECDICYDSCSTLAEKFLQSKEYKNEKYSTYEMLQVWLDNNPDLINEYIETEKSNKKTRQLDNGIVVVDVGFRKEQPIALVQRGKDKDMEYVVAFNYRIKDNKMDWAYGYYYDKDLTKAKEDFNKVLNNGNLANTFEKKEER